MAHSITDKTPQQDDPNEFRKASGSTEAEDTQPASAFDPTRLRLGQDFAALAGVRKLITTVAVRRPDRQQFIRVHPSGDMCLGPVAMIELEGGQDIYLVAPALFEDVGSEAKLKMLYLAITRDGVVFIWPVAMPGPDGRTCAWWESAQRAAETAKTQWVRVTSNRDEGMYETLVPTGLSLPEPEWPDLPFARILELAFRDRIIKSLSHPVLKRLRGE